MKLLFFVCRLEVCELQKMSIKIIDRGFYSYSARVWLQIPAGQTKVAKTGSDSSTAKRSAFGVSVAGPPR